MKSFELKFDWLALGGGDLPAIVHSMAAIELLVEGRNIVRAFDRRSLTVRGQFIVPLYPLAEWIAANWWPLLNESEAPSRGFGLDEYLSRHSFRNAGEGFAFPDVRVFPEGDVTRIEWLPSQSTFQSIEFLGGGQARIPTAAIRQGLADFIEAVLERLRILKVGTTWLHEEWGAIQDAPADEIEFCAAAAWLGLDPYHLDPELTRALQDVWLLPASLHEDFLRAADPSRLQSCMTWVEDGLSRMGTTQGKNHQIESLRSRFPKCLLARQPWDEGYLLARELRADLNLAEVFPLPLENLIGGLSLIPAEKPPTESFDGLLAIDGDSGVRCYSSKRRIESQRFLLARGLLDFLCEEDWKKPVLLTSAQVQNQQRGRAFAAEFLAPAGVIHHRLAGAEVSGEEIEDLAMEFQVSPYVIRHQIQNHTIARILD